jgi:hypothetical protein
MGNSPKPEFTSFAEFWPHYVGEHRKPLCRGIHYVAALLTFGVVLWSLAALDWRPLLLAPLVGYGGAWVAHFAIEHNHPATWGYVWWSLLGEYRMLGLALTGRMAAEMKRLYGSVDPARDAPCRRPSGEVRTPPRDSA